MNLFPALQCSQIKLVQFGSEEKRFTSELTTLSFYVVQLMGHGHVREKAGIK